MPAVSCGLLLLQLETKFLELMRVVAAVETWWAMMVSHFHLRFCWETFVLFVWTNFVAAHLFSGMEKLSGVCLRLLPHPSSPINLVVGSSLFDVEAVVVSQKQQLGYTPGHGRTRQTPVDPEEQASFVSLCPPHRPEPQSCC